MELPYALFYFIRHRKPILKTNPTFREKSKK
jgi:hypothetical protein